MDYYIIESFAENYKFSEPHMDLFRKIFTDSNERPSVQELKSKFTKIQEFYANSTK